MISTWLMLGSGLFALYFGYRLKHRPPDALPQRWIAQENGHRIMIYGGIASIGSLLVLIARYFGYQG